MPRTITVKGIGNVAAKPDLIVITMTIATLDLDYEKSMELSAEKIAQINTALEKIGFEKSSVKTTTFNVSTEYESVKGRDGNYKRIFKGYECTHRLKIEFDLDTKLLAQALNAIATCTAAPDLSIMFTVKNPSAVSEELLRSATINAKAKAEILCSSSDCKLGSLLSIDYNWGELNIVSTTKYSMDEECFAAPCSSIADMDFEPDDIDVRDTVTFVWEIK